LWYWAKAPSSLDCSMAECFLALLSSFSNDSARAPYHHTPGAYRISIGISPRHPAQCHNCYLGIQFWQNSTTQEYRHAHSSIAQSGASIPSCGPPSPG
jgi:hypothetical protein